MLKHRHLDNIQACRHLGVLGSRCTSQHTAELEGNGYSCTGSVEGNRLMIEGQLYYRVVSLTDAQKLYLGMLKNRPTDRSHTCSPPDAFSDWTHQTVQEGTESNGYRGTGPGERVGSVNE